VNQRDEEEFREFVAGRIEASTSPDLLDRPAPDRVDDLAHVREALMSVDEIVRSGRRRARRRTFARGAGIVCGVGAVVLAAATVLPVGDSGGSEPVGSAAVAPAPPFTFTFRGYTVGDFRVTDPLEVTPGYERTPDREVQCGRGRRAPRSRSPPAR